MKKLLYCSLFIALLFIISCESPLKINAPELEEVQGSSFDRTELCDENGFMPGYENGNIQTNQVDLSWSQTEEENFLFYKLSFSIFSSFISN